MLYYVYNNLKNKIKMHKILLTEKVLIAEDNTAMSSVLAHKLKHEGFEVTTAENGKIALEDLQSNTYNLLLMDLTMPEMDGFHLLMEIKKLNIQIPVIVMSSLSQTEDRQRAIALGATKFIIKTEVTPNIIVDEIKKTLGI